MEGSLGAKLFRCEDDREIEGMRWTLRLVDIGCLLQV
jgi:hypothetical protein